MIEFLKGYLDIEWRKKKDVVKFLVDKGFRKKNLERKFRKAVEVYDREYYEGLHDSYIAHSVRGYYLTSDPEIIKKSIADDESRLIALSKRIYGAKRRLREDNQLTLLPKDKTMDAYEILMKMEI